jgi:uncharacterized membrane protein YfcA
MGLDVPAGELALLAAAILVGGAITGLLAGLFGVGGGGVIVPVLYEIFRVIGVSDDVRMQLCVGTSLAIIIPTSYRSYRAHLARGNVPVEILRMWAAPIILGVAIGGITAAVAPAWVFRLTFSLMAGGIAFRLLFGRDTWRFADKLPGRGLMTLYGVVIGLYSALMGVGGGSVSTLVLMLYGRPIHAAVAISAGVGVIISVAGAIGYALAGLPYQSLMPPLSVGFVSLLGVILMAPVSSFVAPYGARLAHKMPKRQLEIAFGIFLLLIAVRFLVTLF